MELSIFITTFGESQYLESTDSEFAKSRLFQEKKGKIFVVNDKPTDPIKKRFKCLSIINNGNNIGEANVWQLSLNLCQSSYFLILADDDQLSTKSFDNILEAIETKPCEIFLSKYRIKSRLKHAKIIFDTPNSILLSSFFFNYGCVSLYCIMRTEKARQFLGLRKLHSGKIAILNEYLLLTELLQLKKECFGLVDAEFIINDDSKSNSISFSDLDYLREASLNILCVFYKKVYSNSLKTIFVAILLNFRIFREYISLLRRTNVRSFKKSSMLFFFSDLDKALQNSRSKGFFSFSLIKLFSFLFCFLYLVIR